MMLAPEVSHFLFISFFTLPDVDPSAQTRRYFLLSFSFFFFLMTFCSCEIISRPRAFLLEAFSIDRAR